MVSIKEAVRNAMDFAQETLGPQRLNGLQLEEVESSNMGGEDAWLITLSMINQDNSLAIALAGPMRDYKVFTVLKKNGEVTSMRIREPAAM